MADAGRRRFMTLSKASQKALDQFDEASRTWGWESDQGTRNVVKAHKQYDLTKQRLEQRIAYLERNLKKLRRARSTFGG